MPPTIDPPKRVLIADDEKDLCLSFAEAFESEGWIARTCFDGASVEGEVQQFDPTVVVLDLRMPNVDGLKVLEQLKSDHPWTQVVILTGHGKEDDAIECLNMGAFGYLRKAVGRDDLLRKCEEARLAVPDTLLAFHQWYAAQPEPDKAVYTTTSGHSVTARQLMEEVRRQTPVGREFIRQVEGVAAELIVTRL